MHRRRRSWRRRCRRRDGVGVDSGEAILHSQENESWRIAEREAQE